MKKLLIITILLTIPFTLLLSTNHDVLAGTSLTGKIILIDPGHGGSDPGSTECPGLEEADANLDIAILLLALIEADGGIGVLLRDGDYDMTNADRYNLANELGGDVLVSIHLNGWYDHALNYTQGLYAKYPKDYLFTQVIHQRLAAELGISDGGVRQFASGVVLKADMPATLQEVVFISSTEECARLTDGTGDRQQQIARALYLGLIDWFDEPLEFEPGKRENPPGGY
jgi:N-acetylmuramoyl-L-alanine amidase